MTFRKLGYVLAMVATTLVAQQPAVAQSKQPLSIVTPYGTAGLGDAVPRLLGERFTVNTGRPVIVENKPGASGIIGAQYFRQKANLNGDTVFLIDNSIYAINPAVYAKLPYQQKDFIPLMQAVQGPFYLVASAKSKVHTVQDLITEARERPGAVMYGSVGNATLHHLGSEQLARVAKIKMTHVPYKGAAELVPGLLSGDVSFGFLTLASVKAHVESGRLRLVAVGSAKRQAATPDVPTLVESGLPGVVIEANMGFAVLAGTPEAVINKLTADFTEALRNPEVKARIEGLGVNVVPTNSALWAAQLNKDAETFGELVRDIGLKLD